MGGVEHFPAGRAGRRLKSARWINENIIPSHFKRVCLWRRKSQSKHNVKWKDFLSLSFFKASFVGVMKRGIDGICSQFCPAAPSGFRGTGRASLTSIVKWWNIRLFFLLLPNNSLKRPNGWIYRTAFDGSVLRSRNNFFEIPPLLRKFSELKTRPTLSSQCSCQTDQYLLRQPSKTNINQWENINTVAMSLDCYHQLWSIIPSQPRMFRSPAP